MSDIWPLADQVLSLAASGLHATPTNSCAATLPEQKLEQSAQAPQSGCALPHMPQVTEVFHTKWVDGTRS